MDPENITGSELPDASQLNAPGSEPTVGSVPAAPAATAPTQTVEALSLAEINASLGKQFPTKEAAIKAFKDTFSYVGKKKEDIEREVRANVQADSRIDQLAKELEAERKERFFDRNPQYADPAVRKFIEKVGGNPQDVVNSEEFKGIFNKVVEYDKSAKLKTVLESNPRLQVSKDSLSKARDIASTAVRPDGQLTGKAKEESERLVLDAVKSAYEF